MADSGFSEISPAEVFNEHCISVANSRVVCRRKKDVGESIALEIDDQGFRLGKRDTGKHLLYPRRRLRHAKDGRKEKGSKDPWHGRWNSYLMIR